MRATLFFRHTTWLAVAVLLAFASCAPVDRAVPEPEQKINLIPGQFTDLQGWQTDDAAAALGAFRASCRAIIAGTGGVMNARFGEAASWRDICNASFRVRPGAADEARHFFEKHFRPHLVVSVDENQSSEQGLFTGYYEPELRGARKKSTEFPVPLLAPPPGLVTADLGLFDKSLSGRSITGRVQSGRLLPLPGRAEIEGGALSGEADEILWLADAVDAFFLHIQGSGRVVMKDGSVTRVGYAGRNGHPYTPIGRALIESGEISAENMSMQAIRDWIEKNPAQGRALMQKNESYIFFRQMEGEGPTGASGVELTPGRSLAVDSRHLPFGVPLWLETTEPGTPPRPLHRLVVAQDTGAAIRGAVRGDLFWGFGPDAALKAGHMKEAGRYFVLLPRGPKFQ